MKCIKCGKLINWWTKRCNCSLGIATSELTEIQFDELNDEDYIRITDTSKLTSCKVSLGSLKKFIKS